MEEFNNYGINPMDEVEEIVENPMEIIEQNMRGLNGKQQEQPLQFNDVFYNPQQDVVNEEPLDSNEHHASQEEINGFIQEADRQTQNNTQEPVLNEDVFQTEEYVIFSPAYKIQTNRQSDITGDDFIHDKFYKLYKILHEFQYDNSYDSFIDNLSSMLQKHVSDPKEENEKKWLMENTLSVITPIGQLLLGFYVFVPYRIPYEGEVYGSYDTYFFDMQGNLACNFIIDTARKYFVYAKSREVFDYDNITPMWQRCRQLAMQQLQPQEQLQEQEQIQEQPQEQLQEQLPQITQSSQQFLSRQNQSNNEIRQDQNGIEGDDDNLLQINDRINVAPFKDLGVNSSDTRILDTLYVPQGKGSYPIQNRDTNQDRDLIINMTLLNFGGKINNLADINLKTNHNIFKPGQIKIEKIKEKELICIRYRNGKGIFFRLGVNRIGECFVPQDYIITGRYASTLLNKINTVSSVSPGKFYSQLIDFEGIENDDVRILMKAFDINYYVCLAKENYEKSDECRKTSNEYRETFKSNRSNLIYRLLYTTRLNGTSLNVNFNLENNINVIVGLPSYGIKSRPNNLIGIMLLTNPPILVSLTSKPHRGSKTIYRKSGNLSYVSSIGGRKKVIRRHGELVLQNRVIIGKSIRDDGQAVITDNCSNFEYKWINEIIFVDGDYTVLIQIIPYIVNESREDCYQYDVVAFFYSKGELSQTLTGHDFFIYEEGVNDYITWLSAKELYNFTKDVIPAALKEGGVCVPPITNMDKIFRDN